MSKLPLILTTGEPAGIGPDLCIMLYEYLCEQNIVLCGDIELLRSRAALHGKDLNFHYHSDSKIKHSLPVLHIQCPSSVTCGQLDTANAEYVLGMLQTACKLTQSGYFSGIVTAPIHKGIICQAGHHFSGHTEFFAEQLAVKKPIMLLATSQLKVALMTTHLPLAAVANSITTKLIETVIPILDQDIRRYFTNNKPSKIGVCGLNPHAGEGGHIGNEEINIINPALNKLRQHGYHVSEALPADTLFVAEQANQYDVILAMYHDQGLPVIKSQGFGECVNITLGLPIIRTSVDHGTALNLAGTTKANPNSLQCAIELAKEMVKGKGQHHVS